MGFLKRIFSIGSKKSKKRPHVVHDVDAGLRTIEEEEHEAAVGRLLRSSSARFAVVSELDYTSLPPLPHPINEVLQTPATSTVSIASTSMSQRGTYNVTIHGRKQHTAPEYVPLTPERYTSRSGRPGENSQLLGLRSDPSVASLLDMYDEHGRISPTAFSNSPPSPQKRERTQTRRNGSTLRQLLGNPSSVSSQNDANDLEGDISWAERFLEEAETASSTSSLGFYTPTTPDAPFPDNDTHYNNKCHDPTIFSEHDLSINTTENRTISSMEVELSMGIESVVSLNEFPRYREPRPNLDPITPRRASQVFKFLTEKRRTSTVGDEYGSLPELPNTFSSSSTKNSQVHSHFSEVSSDSIYSPSAIPAIPPHFNDISTTLLDHTTGLSMLHISPETPSHDTNCSKIENAVEVIMTVPTKVIVTAPTPCTNRNNTIYRAPRGPRSHPRRFASGSSNKKCAALADHNPSRSNSTISVDPFTPVPPRRKHHRRSTSQSSVSISLSSDQPLLQKTTSPRRTKTRSILTESDKENATGLSAIPQIPTTPLRRKSKSSPRDSRSLFRVAVNPGMFQPPMGMTPSPASSSELSPVGRQLMTDLRQQRTKARGAERRGRVKN
ncbi:hypothetical protein BDZ94DRAFT_1221779 [Collybia nuda]|uniref:Uncharacterized protein n=1 Tax=Collybia nuda TaxID=64659 RepID=A0A9P6CHT2_9AGAR|nr:hypothetical protein BDZ94DRAFT_1221779 [Collybia nuda]